MDYKDIGLRIKNHRQIQGLSQRSLADKIGTTWEMVSRYETGKSSPLGRIDRIAETLKVPVHRLLQPDTVSDTHGTYSRNTVPLLDHKFSDLNEALSSTKTFYVAPDWIVGKYSRVFAIDLSAVIVSTNQLDKTGVAFLAQEEPEVKTDLILIKSPTGMEITSASTATRGAKPLATVIAWEKRFK